MSYLYCVLDIPQPLRDVFICCACNRKKGGLQGQKESARRTSFGVGERDRLALGFFHTKEA